ncbi:MAG TPA: KTSC domain-containing protein [Patescibacteria group bacterium]|nr:KTSC domain-containing protein [Patescibacteria group bacterium]
MPSTVIQSYEYSPALQMLDITFTSGVRYQYLEVPPFTVERFKRAFSKGQFFSKHIRPVYRFQRVHD